MRSGHLSMAQADQYRVPVVGAALIFEVQMAIKPYAVLQVMPLMDHQRYMSVAISQQQCVMDYGQVGGRGAGDAVGMSDGGSEFGRVSMQDRYGRRLINFLFGEGQVKGGNKNMRNVDTRMFDWST